MASTSDPAVTSVVTAVVTAVVNGTAVTLSHRSAAVLEALADGTVVSREQLIRHAGLHDLSQRRCEGIIVELRKALGPDAIVNVRRRGWRLVTPVEITR
ncbi:MAG: hypothetical protein M9952_15425 [Microthrixaceae bacterium]|nr:winged helix-turn-helix domain-containing protein [Microthrixaceae bacterium]MCO5314313.1 hypothetical protein [Microthrixaceae bacterium]